MVSFIEKHGFFYEFPATFSSNVCFCIRADKPLSLFTSLWGGSVSVDFIFQIMLGSKENIHHSLASVESTLILTFRIIDLQIYRTALPSLLTQT